MRLACFVVCISMCWPPMVLTAQEAAMRGMEKPNFPPMPVFAADAVVHILPSTMPENSTLGDSRAGRWVQRGFSLRGLISLLYRIDETRVEFTNPTLASRRYDVSTAVLPVEDEKATLERVKQALGTTLHLAIVPETRTMEVYVVSSPQGPGPGMKAAAGGGGIGGSGLSLSVMRPAGGASAASRGQEPLAGKISGGAVTSGSLSVGGPVLFLCPRAGGGTGSPSGR